MRQFIERHKEKIGIGLLATATAGAGLGLTGIHQSLGIGYLDAPETYMNTQEGQAIIRQTTAEHNDCHLKLDNMRFQRNLLDAYDDTVSFMGLEFPYTDLLSDIGRRDLQQTQDTLDTAISETTAECSALPDPTSGWEQASYVRDIPSFQEWYDRRDSQSKTLALTGFGLLAGAVGGLIGTAYSLPQGRKEQG